MDKKPSQAVALRYDPDRDHAPRVLAKGSGVVADNIIAAAQRHRIPLIADPIAGPLLARADLDAEIDPEFFQAVAEILAFVYRLDGKLPKG